MGMLDGIKKGNKVVKILTGAGCETASIQEVAKVSVKKGLVYTDLDHIEDDGVSTFRISDGRAVANYISGFSSRLVVLEE